MLVHNVYTITCLHHSSCPHVVRSAVRQSWSDTTALPPCACSSLGMVSSKAYGLPGSPQALLLWSLRTLGTQRMPCARATVCVPGSWTLIYSMPEPDISSRHHLLHGMLVLHVSSRSPRTVASTVVSSMSATRPVSPPQDSICPIVSSVAHNGCQYPST